MAAINLGRDAIGGVYWGVKLRASGVNRQFGTQYVLSKLQRVLIPNRE